MQAGSPVPRLQGDGKSVDDILEDGEGNLHFAIGRWPTAGPEPTAEPTLEEEPTHEIEWAELQGVGPNEDGYGQAVGMLWDKKGAPAVFARYFGSLSNGLPNGYGKLELEEKGVYKGGVANGKPHGMGQHIMPDGATYWGIWEDGCFGRLGGGVGVWHYTTSDTTVHGMWYEGSDLERDEAAPIGLLEELSEDDARIETCYTETNAAVASADHAIKRAGEAIMKQHASASSDKALQKGVGQRAYEALSLRQLFPPESSALAKGGVVERLERRAATAPAQREGGINGGERDTHLLKHKIAKRYAVDRQTSGQHEAGHLGSNAKATCSPAVRGAATLELVRPARRGITITLPGMHRAAAWNAQGCSLGCTGLQPGMQHRAAAWDAQGCSLGCTGLQPGMHRAVTLPLHYRYITITLLSDYHYITVTLPLHHLLQHSASSLAPPA